METALFVAAASASGLTVPIELWATKHLVDTLALRAGEAAGGAPAVWLWFGILVGALIVNRIISALEPLYRIKMREVAGHNLEAAAMRKTSRLELIAFENQSFYNQLDRVMQGSYGRGPDVLQNVVGIVGRAPSIIGYTVILAYYAPVLLLISLGSVLAFIAAIWRMGEYSWKLLYEQTHSRRLADYFASALGSHAHVKELRIYGLSRHFLDRWSSLYWQTRNDQRRLAARQSIHERLLIIVAVVVSMTGLWWVISRGLVSASPGEYAIIFTALLGMWSIADMSITIKELGEAAGYAGEFRAFLALPQEEGSRALLGAVRSGKLSGSEESSGFGASSESNGTTEPNRNFSTVPNALAQRDPI